MKKKEEIIVNPMKMIRRFNYRGNNFSAADMHKFNVRLKLIKGI